MTDIRQSLHTFLQSVSTWEIRNAMVQFTEPDAYVSYYILNDDTFTQATGNREYNPTDDLVDATFNIVTGATVQIDVRGDGSFAESRNLYYGLQIWQEELKNAGLFYRGVGSIVPIPQVQNGYVKEGYQFNLNVGYDASLVKQIQYGETIEWL
jgi:hypothetical protein